MIMNQDGPTKFGDYYLIDKIAVGGMAEIWRAKTVGLEGFERLIALKCILPSYTQNPEFNSMFIDEARIASTLNHSNIVRITNFGVIDNKYYHEMEFVDGRNLRQIFQKCREEHVHLPIDSACYIMSEVCKGLHYAHTKHDSVNNEPLNIIHRDMSPQNIMLSYEGEVKIIDWGIAKAKGKIEETRAGVLKGKFGYMSPEQAEGEELDLRTDLFSIGIVLYEAVVGERLFIADNEINTLKKIKEGVIPLPSRVNPEVDKELESIILKSLTRPRLERYQTCFDMYEDLLRYLHKRFPAYNSLKLSKFVKELFSNEIIADRKRVHEKEQSVPSYSAASYSNRVPGDNTRVSSKTGATGSTTQDKSFRSTSKSVTEYGEAERTLLDESSAEEPSSHTNETDAGRTSTVADSQISYKYEELSYKPSMLKKLLADKKKLIIGVIILIAVIYFLAPSGSVPPEQQQPADTGTPSAATEAQPAAVETPPATTEAPPAQEPTVAGTIKQTMTPDRPAQVEKFGSLSLTSTPASAEVVIDGVNRGKTPITISDLVLGKRYELTLKANRFEPETKYFTLRKENNNLVIPLTPLRGTGISYLTLDVEPPVLIYIDGKIVAQYKSLYMYNVEPGTHVVRFFNDKLRIDHTMRIHVDKGSNIKKNITLR